MTGTPVPHQEPKPFTAKDGDIGLPRYTGPRFAGYATRAKHTRELYGLIEQAAGTQTTQEWLDILKPLSIPVVKTNTPRRPRQRPPPQSRRLLPGPPPPRPRRLPPHETPGEVLEVPVEHPAASAEAGGAHGGGVGGIRRDGGGGGAGLRSIARRQAAPHQLRPLTARCYGFRCMNQPARLRQSKGAALAAATLSGMLIAASLLNLLNAALLSRTYHLGGRRGFPSGWKALAEHPVLFWADVAGSAAALAFGVLLGYLAFRQIQKI